MLRYAIIPAMICINLSTSTYSLAQPALKDSLEGCPFEIAVQHVDEFVRSKNLELSNAQMEAATTMQAASKNATKPGVAIGLQMSPAEREQFNAARHKSIDLNVEQAALSKFQRNVHIVYAIMDIAKLSDDYDVAPTGLGNEDPRQFYFKILLMLRANQLSPVRTSKLNFGIDCDPEAGLFWEEDFALHEMAKNPNVEVRSKNLVADAERIRSLYHLMWNIFNRSIDDARSIRWVGDEPHLSNSIDTAIDSSSEETKRIYKIVMPYIDGQMPSEYELKMQFATRVADKAKHDYPVTPP